MNSSFIVPASGRTSPKNRQKGNYLLSIGVGIMILSILAVWGIPKVESYLIEGAIPPVAEDVQRFSSRIRTNAAGSGITPYTGLTQDIFARAMRDTTLMVGDVAGESGGSTVVRHGLGGGTNGTVEISETGDSFSLTFNSVSNYACPGLSTALQRTFDTISIGGSNVKVTDATTGEVTSAYQASSASVQCSDGDSNTFVFTTEGM